MQIAKPLHVVCLLAALSSEAFADLGGEGSANIDGRIDKDEWQGASTTTVPITTERGKSVSATLRVMNDERNIYFALEVPASVGAKQLTLEFDNDGDGEAENGDDVLRLDADKGFVDAVRTSGECTAETRGAECILADRDHGGTNDGLGAVVHSSQGAAFEIAHPVASDDDRNDFRSDVGVEIGMFLELSDDDGLRVIWPSFRVYKRLVFLHVFYPTRLKAAAGTPTVDGVMSAGEWEGATPVDFYVKDNDGEWHPAELYAMNDHYNLYLGLRVYRPLLGRTSLSFRFDHDLDGLVENGDDEILVGFDPIPGTYFGDGFRTDQPPCTPVPASPGQCGFSDEDDGGTIEGAGAITNNGTFSMYEVRHPLDSTDDAHDFSLAPGDLVGVTLDLRLCDPCAIAFFPGLTEYLILELAWLYPGQNTTLPAGCGNLGTPLLDGAVSSGEYSNAPVLNLTLQDHDGAVIAGDFRAVNVGGVLHVALRVQRPTLLTSMSLLVDFDDDNNGIKDIGEDLILANMVGLGFHDMVFSSQSPCGPSGCRLFDFYVGGSINGGAAIGHDGTYAIVEMAHPLQSGDVNDLSVSPGALLGFRLEVGLGGGFSRYPYNGDFATLQLCAN